MRPMQQTLVSAYCLFYQLNVKERTKINYHENIVYANVANGVNPLSDKSELNSFLKQTWKSSVSVTMNCA